MTQEYGNGFETVDANPAANGHRSTKAFPVNPDWEFLLPPKLAKFDWRDHGLAPVMRHQGDWNACTSFALSAVVEARRHLRGLQTPRLAGGYVHFCRIGETKQEKGHAAPEVAAEASARGLMSGAIDGPPLTQLQCAYDTVAAVRIIGSGYSEPGAKAADKLVAEGPQLIEVPMPLNFDKLRQHDVFRTGNLDCPVLHSMMLTGYDWGAQTITMLGSHGVNWGNGGYVTMNMNDALFFNRWVFGVTV